MTKPKTKKLDEKSLGERAYTAYLVGRMAGSVTADSPARWALVTRYSMPGRQPCEVYTFLAGLRDAGCPILSPEELLGTVYRELGMADGVAS